MTVLAYAVVGGVLIAFFYILVIRTTPSDFILTLPSAADLKAIRRYLAGQGVATFIKNEDVRRNHTPGVQATGAVNPSLHVLDPAEAGKAKRLLAKFWRLQG